MSGMSLSTKTIKLPTGEQTVCLPTITHCYLLTHCLKDGPVAAVIMANVVANVANLMSEGTAPCMGRPVIDAKASIILKLFVVPRLQPRRRRALTEARSHSRTDVVPPGATLARAKEVASDKGSMKQVQAENANALHNSSDSETESRLQDIQEEPRRCIGPSRVKELAKFFTPTSDEEENSRVNSRT